MTVFTCSQSMTTLLFHVGNKTDTMLEVRTARKRDVSQTYDHSSANENTRISLVSDIKTFFKKYDVNKYWFNGDVSHTFM